MSGHALHESPRGEYSLQHQEEQSEWELECLDAVYRVSATYDAGALRDYDVGVSSEPSVLCQISLLFH